MWDTILAWKHPWIGGMRRFNIGPTLLYSTLTRNTLKENTMIISTPTRMDFLFLPNTPLEYWGYWPTSFHWRDLNIHSYIWWYYGNCINQWWSNTCLFGSHIHTMWVIILITLIPRSIIADQQLRGSIL